jgi:hypothetical protein
MSDLQTLWQSMLLYCLRFMQYSCKSGTALAAAQLCSTKIFSAAEAGLKGAMPASCTALW